MEYRLQGEELPVTDGMSGRSAGRRAAVAIACGLVVLALVLAATQLRDRPATATRHQGADAPAAAGHQSGHAPLPAAGHSGHSSSAAGSGAIKQATTPAQATLQLQALIGQHSVLSADMMRGRLRGDPDFAQAANAAIGKNTDAMAQLVGSLFGSAAQKQFATLWSTHVTYLFNYARGLADRDNSVRDEARKELTAYESQLARFFVGASKGRLSQAAAESGLHAHVNHLVQQADAYAARDYTRSTKLYRDAYAHSFALGTAVATALLGPRASAALNDPQWRLQSELGRLLGEHVSLVVAAIRPGTAKGADFPAAAEALNANTRDLTAAVDSLFGAAPAKQFQSLWADHIDQVVAYAGAVVRGDASGRDEARKMLDSFQGRLAAFLNAATGKRLATPALAEALAMHDELLLREVDALAAKEYQQAHDIAYSAYQHMFDLAGKLSGAFGATIASRVPRGGAQTGLGGTGTVGPR